MPRFLIEIEHIGSDIILIVHDEMHGLGIHLE